MTAAALAIVCLMTVTWGISIAVRDASIVDLVWGLGFVIIGWVSVATGNGGARSTVMAVLLTLWGLRLSLYLARRNLGAGEDRRYQAMRRRWGARFPLVSAVTVFALQGALMWVVSLPVQGVAGSAARPLGWIAVLGIAVWTVGLLFEAIGDWQLSRFLADPRHAGTVMDRGLWRYTRHPNYFGDAAVWWGIGLIAIEVPGLWWTAIGPIVMTVLLRRVSGVALLERSIGRRREGYDAYIARTSPFFPLPPRKL